MTTPIHILLLEDNPADVELITNELTQSGLSAVWTRVENQAAYLAQLAARPDIILADHALPQFNGRQALKLLQEQSLDIPFIVISGTIGEEEAAEYIKLGAADYLLKDRLRRLGSAITQALKQHQLRDEKQQAEEALRQSYSRLENLVEVRTAELLEVNKTLQAEIAERKRAQESLAAERNLLQQYQNDLEALVAARTDQLQTTNSQLRQEVQERIQIQKALQQQTERAEALALISQAAATSSDDGYQPTLDHITHRAATLIGDACVISLLAADGSQLEPASFFDLQAQTADTARQSILAVSQLDQQGPGWHVLVSGEAFIWNEGDPTAVSMTETEAQTAEADFDLHGLLIVPLRVQGDGIGILGLARETAGPPYREADRRFAQELADRAAIAVENARLQQAVRRHTAELEQRVAARTADLEAFAYSVSHDLRAPLRAIIGFSEILARRHQEDLNEEGQHYLQNVIRAGTQMGRLIEDLLAYSRLGRQSLQMEVVPLTNLLEQVISNLSNKITTKAAEIIVPDTQARIMSNWTLLSEIFTNLIDNALTYQQPDLKPQVQISYFLQEKPFRFTVTDNGIGISSEYYERIFQTFQRLHSADTYPGTGIGLAIVKKSVELLGGTIWVESRVGQGTTFTFTLPAQPAT
jgi:signal transduction histidine kinase/DNA-binding response OmpR family regulator